MTDFVKLRQLLDDSYEIVLIGLTQKQIDSLPAGIHGIARTNNIDELVQYYNKADVFVNPTYEDNFPTTNIEALACGAPVITYNTGGSPEAVDTNTGLVVEYGNINTLAEGIRSICNYANTEERRLLCRQRAERFFNKNERYQQYIDLYSKLV